VRRALLALLATAGGIAVIAAQGRDPCPAIHTMLDISAVAWNRGDLDGFVSTYAADSTTTFVSGGQVQHGFDWIRRNYAPRFVAGAVRDSLRFERFACRTLGTDNTLVTSRYVLLRRDSVTSSGPFTLIVQRRPGGWKIIHDHTSSDR
jgi:beta-aspartyl-peptidase (threonine type)